MVRAIENLRPETDTAGQKKANGVASSGQCDQTQQGACERQASEPLGSMPPDDDFFDMSDVAGWANEAGIYYKTMRDVRQGIVGKRKD